MQFPVIRLIFPSSEFIVDVTTLVHGHVLDCCEV